MSSTTGTELVIETSGLRKEFSGKGGTRVAVDDLDLAVPRGGVHGFLGPNGSGKTATIRMLLGLARPTAGTMALFGTPVPDHLDEVIGRVGAVVESPKFSPTFSAPQNLCCSPGRSASPTRRSTMPWSASVSVIAPRTASGPTRSA